MQLKILGVGNSPLLSVKVKTLDDANLLNVSALARMLGVTEVHSFREWRIRDSKRQFYISLRSKSSGMCSPHGQRKMQPHLLQPAMLISATTPHIKPDGKPSGFFGGFLLFQNPKPDWVVSS
jgi:hypothetical protein